MSDLEKVTIYLDKATLFLLDEEVKVSPVKTNRTKLISELTRVGLTCGKNEVKFEMDDDLFQEFEECRAFFSKDKLAMVTPEAFMEHIVHLGMTIQSGINTLHNEEGVSVVPNSNTIYAAFRYGMEERRKLNKFQRKLSKDKEEFDRKIKEDPYFDSMQTL